PVVSYAMDFFSIGDRSIADDAASAIKPLPILGDPWASEREDAATHAVGVAATVTFVTQRAEMPGDTDSRDNDELRSVTYFYDLELDKDGNILGGYWYQDVHPDLLWRPEPGHLVSTWGDGFVRGNWSYDQGELPWSW